MRNRLARSLILLIALTSHVAGKDGNDVAVVVNQHNLVVNVSVAELRKIFSGERLSWAGGIPIKLLTRGPGAREHNCLLNLLHMTESEYEQYWKDRSGAGSETPVTLPSNGMQKEAIQVFPGAIAIVQMSDVRSPMRVIKVDGRFPNENGYPLH